MTRTLARARPAAAALVALACLLAAPPAPAQMQLETRVGFADTLRLGRWAPVELSFYNPGGARRGEAYARLRRGAPAREVEYIERVEIPHQGRRTVQFVLPLLGTDHPLELGMRGEDGRPVVEQTVTLDQYRTTDALVLAMTRNVDLEFLPSLQRRKTVIAYVRPDQLPTRWAGLDGVRALIVHDASLSELEQSRYEALLDWVHTGGILVFAGGASYSLLQGPRERELLPVRVRGLMQARKLPVLPNLPGMAMPEGDWTLIDSVLERGEALAEVDGKPLIARRELGLGEIYFLALDYAAARLTSWAGNFALWDLLLALDKEAVKLDALAEEMDVEAAQHPAAELLRQPLLHFPSRAGVAGFVLIYALLVAAALQLIRAGRLRAAQGRGSARPLLLGWGALGLVVVAGALAAWFWLREPLLHADAAILALKTQTLRAGEEQSLLVEHAGIFSSRGGRADLAFAEPTTVVRALAQVGPQDRTAPDGPIRITREGGRLHWRNLGVPRFSAALLTLESVRKAPVSVQVTRHGNATALALENRGGHAVAASLVLQRGVLYETGALHPGATREEDFFDVKLRPSETAQPVANLVSEHLPPLLDGLGPVIPRQLVHRYFHARVLGDIDDRLIWLGWIPGDDPGLRVENGSQHSVSLTLLVAEVEL